METACQMVSAKDGACKEEAHHKFWGLHLCCKHMDLMVAGVLVLSEARDAEHHRQFVEEMNRPKPERTAMPPFESSQDKVITILERFNLQSFKRPKPDDEKK